MKAPAPVSATVRGAVLAIDFSPALLCFNRGGIKHRMSVMPFYPDFFRIEGEIRIQSGKDLSLALQVLQLVHPVTETIVHTTVLERCLFICLTRGHMHMPAGPLKYGVGLDPCSCKHHRTVSVISELVHHVQLLRCGGFKQLQVVVSMTGIDHPVKKLTALCCLNHNIIGTTGHMEHI